MDTVSIRPQKETTFKQKMAVLGIGCVIALYLGLLCGACYTDGLNTLFDNFYQFVIVEHHFIVPVTEHTLPFVGAFVFLVFIIWALWVARINHPYKGREYGSRHFIDPREFTKMFSDTDKRDEITLNNGGTTDYDVYYASGIVSHRKLPTVKMNPYNRRISQNCYVDIRNKKTSNLNMLVVGPPGCVSGDTEFYDGEKWKRISDYTEGDKVLAYDPDKRTPVLVEPERYIKNPCDGFYHIKTDDGKIEQVLSYDHEILYYDDNNEAHKIFCGDFVEAVINHIAFTGSIRVSAKSDKYVTLSSANAKVKLCACPDGYKYCFTVPTGALFFRYHGHVFATGNCGKTYRFCKPILSGLNGNYFVTDPKGELCRETAQYFIDNGYEVLTIDVRDTAGMARSVRFNPFVYLRDQKDLNELVEVLLASTTPPDANKGDPFWEKSETKFFMALFELIFYSYPKEKQCWRTLVDLIDKTEILQDENGNIVPNDIMKEMERYNELWKKEHDGQVHPAYQDYKDVFGGAFETVASIVLSAKVRCTKMKLEAAKAMMDYNELDIFEKFAYCKKTKKCPTGKRILYIVTKESDHSMDWYVSILYMTLFTQLYDKADNDFHGKLPEHCTFLMDEFANVTLSQNFRELLSTMRGRNISAIMIVQTYQQLKEKYPKNDAWQGLIGQCCFRLLLGPPDKETREYFSKMLGTTTINKQNQTNPQGGLMGGGGKGEFNQTEDVISRDLMTVGDLGEIPMEDCIIDVNGSSPVYDQKVVMEEDPIYGLMCNRARNYTPPESVNAPTDVFFGDEAEEVIKNAKEEGYKVITLTEDDLDALFDADFIADNMQVETVSADVIQRNYEEFLQDQRDAEIDFNDYSRSEMMVVQGLKNKGFSPKQIHAMDAFIHHGAAIDELLMFFNADMPSAEISDFINRIGA